MLIKLLSEGGLSMNRKRIFYLLLIILMFCGIITSCKSSEPSWQDLHDKTAETLSKNTEVNVGAVGGEWIIIGLSQSDRLSEDMAMAYLKNTQDYVNSIGSNRLHEVKSTENSRLILGITAAGGDPTDMGGYDLLSGLADMEYIKARGNNGPIWALIAFDCGGYAIPTNENIENQVTREKLIEYLLSTQCVNGGWGFIEDSSDVNMTAMALQALATYIEQESIKSSVTSALEFLSNQQNEQGGFESHGTINSESCAQVIVALCSLGIDPLKDERFIKNGNTVLSALCNFAVEGGFCHQLDMKEADAMATEQAFYALTSYYRFINGKSPLYDMKEIK